MRVKRRSPYAKAAQWTGEVTSLMGCLSLLGEGVLQSQTDALGMPFQVMPRGEGGKHDLLVIGREGPLTASAGDWVLYEEGSEGEGFFSVMGPEEFDSFWTPEDTTPLHASYSVQKEVRCPLCEADDKLKGANIPSLTIGFTKRGLQVWCWRHQANVMHIDFMGLRHPANIDQQVPTSTEEQ